MVETSRKVRVLRDHVRVLRENCLGQCKLRVHRETVVADALAEMARKPAAELVRSGYPRQLIHLSHWCAAPRFYFIFFLSQIKPLSVSFADEAGVDAGGLAAEMLFLVFTQLCAAEGAPAGVPTALFECAGDGEGMPTFLPTKDDSSDDEEVMAYYEGVGRLLVRCIIDQRPVPVRFAPSFYKFLLHLPVNLHDFDAFDFQQASNVRKVLTMPPEEVEFLGMSFADLGQEDESVCAANRERYVDEYVRQALVRSRKKKLRAVRKGFEAAPGVVAHIRLFSYIELMRLLSAQQNISPEQLVEHVRFQGFHNGAFPDIVRQILLQFTAEQVQRFLLFSTASVSLPPRSRPITFVRAQRADLLPVAHTCFNRIDMPEPDTEEQVRQGLVHALSYLEESGFGIA